MKLNLANLAGGQLIHDVDYAFIRVCENIADPNTATDSERKVTITIKIKPDDKGQMILLNYQIKSELAGPVPGSMIVWLGMDENRQLGLFDGLDEMQNELQFQEKRR